LTLPILTLGRRKINRRRAQGTRTTSRTRPTRTPAISRR
jgi:hypothetical protein